jgi:hypothetical protein
VKGIELMESFFENAGEIIAAAASNSFGLVALISLICGVLAFWWFRNSSEWIRLSIIVLLFLGGLLFAFASGLEVSMSDPEPPRDFAPNSIRLSNSTEALLEEYLQKQGSPIDSDTKSQVIEEALTVYLEEPTPETAQPSQLSPGIEQSESILDSETVAGYQFDLYGCLRTDETGVVICNFAITNQEADRTLRIYSQNSPESRIVGSNGVPYEASNIDFGTESSPYQAETKLPQGVLIRSSLTFSQIPEEINNLALLEINAYTYSERNSSTIQFRDIPITT